jgi:hypothetical protein
VLDHGEREPSLVDALTRVVDAGQRVLVDRFDLARLDVQRVASRGLRSMAWLLVGAFVVCAGWLALCGAAVSVLGAYVTLPASLALVGLVNLAAGGTLVGVGVQRAREALDVGGTTNGTGGPA